MKKQTLATAAAAIFIGIFTGAASADFSIDVQIGRDQPRYVEPVYETHCEKVWVEPIYERRVERVWREPVVENRCERVWVGDRYEWREVPFTDCGRTVIVRQQVLVEPGHFEERVTPIVVRAGYYENAETSVCVRAGGWQAVERRVLVRDGYYAAPTYSRSNADIRYDRPDYSQRSVATDRESRAGRVEVRSGRDADDGDAYRQARSRDRDQQPKLERSVNGDRGDRYRR